MIVTLWVDQAFQHFTVVSFQVCLYFLTWFLYVHLSKHFVNKSTAAHSNDKEPLWYRHRHTTWGSPFL
ncbi:hypothetical protein DKP78_15470 [Enterococcus faecium]|nr:hypothetical protein DKP78_15470 [Enterococcus faecium]